jgi:hypothetical protein
MLFDNWVNLLSDKSKENLNNLIHTRRVGVSSGSFSATVPRKVVKIVRNNQ